MASAPRPFQLALYGGFALLFFLAIFLFSTFSGNTGSGTARGSVTIWGTLDERTVQMQLANLQRNEQLNQSVTYRQIDADSFDRELVNAVAQGESPDLVVIPHTKLVQRRSMLFPMSYDLLTRREFENRYVDGFSLFSRPDGLYAFPLAVDPLLMYWNRDIYANNGFAQAPQTWEQIVNQTVPTIVRRTTDRRIQMSPVALGEYRNNRNAFATLSALTLQSGSRMVVEDRGRYNIELSVGQAAGERNPQAAALQFFTQFAIPSSPLYSWSRTKRTDRDEFLTGNLATYFGFGSEAEAMRRQNPNQNFDVTQFPQAAGATINRTYGTFYGVGILRAAPNLDGAYAVAQVLTAPQSASTIANELGMAPPYRQAITAGTDGVTAQVIYDSALIARGWLSPDDNNIDQIFQQAVDDILAGRTTAAGAVGDLTTRLRQQF